MFRQSNELKVKVARRVLLKRGYEIEHREECLVVSFPGKRVFQNCISCLLNNELELIKLAANVLKAERLTGMHFEKKQGKT